MVYPGIALFLMAGLALGGAIYYLVNVNNPRQQYVYGNRRPIDSPSYPAPRPISGETRRRKKKLSCYICTEDLNESDCDTLLCGHKFHKDCWVGWLKIRKCCPECSVSKNTQTRTLKKDDLKKVVENDDLKKVVENDDLKKVVENDDLSNGTQGEEVVCCCCLDEVEEADTKVTLKCKHKCHGKCFVKWMSTNQTCPMCRAIAI